MRTLCICSIFFALSCFPHTLGIISIECGSNLYTNGTIANTSLYYIFPQCMHCRTKKDICHFIYFKGDTLCFSVKCNRDLANASVTAYYKNPFNNTLVHAERIDIYKNTVSGFILIGSLLEHLYIDSIPATTTFSISLPCVVIIHITLDSQQVNGSIEVTMNITMQ